MMQLQRCLINNIKQRAGALACAICSRSQRSQSQPAGSDRSDRCVRRAVFSDWSQPAGSDLTLEGK